MVSHCLFRLALLLLFNRFCQAQKNFFQVPFSGKHYGPDGPWQVISVRFGGRPGEFFNPANEPGNVIDVIPGGIMTSLVPTNVSCYPFDNSSKICGLGGFWSPPAFESGDGEMQSSPIWTDAPSGIILSPIGDLRLDQAVTINGKTVYNASLSAVDNYTITNPNGSQMGMQLGSLSLGGPEQYQSMVTSYDNTSFDTIGFTFAGALYNQSVIPSYSFGMHIGSAPLNYSGSLVFGGYDQGRAIGPYTSFQAYAGNGQDSDTILLDVQIGVETGGTPFSFLSATELLVDESGIPSSIPVNIDSSEPYLFLPNNTCKTIATLLPITYDTSLDYWVWDTTDPNLGKILTSPAHLSFVFPPAPGATANVTIKVPLILLNLTLEAPISTIPTPYFPCISYETSNGTAVLGRAFLQAAFLARNWNSNNAWLAQAPGPGPAGIGLGSSIQNIQTSDTTITLYDNSTLFAASWSNHWTVLPANNITGTMAPKSQPQSQSLSGGDIAGIVIGVLFGLGAVLFGVFLWRARRRKHLVVVPNKNKPDDSGPASAPAHTLELPGHPQVHALELPSQRRVQELPVD